MLKFLASSMLLLAFALTTRAAAPIELELATESGVQITAPHEWLQLLTNLGFDNVRIRGVEPGDEPQVENRGTAERPRYHVTGLLTARDQLVLPGATFTSGDRSRLKDYFDRLAADGGESLTAERGMFGLTKKEVDAVFADLTQPVDFETKGQSPRAIIDQLQPSLSLKFSIAPDAKRRLSAAPALVDEMKGITAGTALAMMLHNVGLVLQPQKSRGEPVALQVALAGADAAAANTLGKTADHDIPHWPIGWELQKIPGDAAPSLFEFLNAEIEGYTLEEALAAISPRLKVPLYFDRAALSAYKIDPAKIQVRLARTRTTYKRVIDRVLSQARLGSQLRVDEAGTPFLWITR